VGFTALAVWPCLAAVRDRPMPWALRPAPSFSVTVMLLAGAAWFLLELHGHGAAGFAERVLTAAQATWPLVVAASLRLTFGPASRSASPSGAPTTDTRSA
jgi:hypothetical protein